MTELEIIKQELEGIKKTLNDISQVIIFKPKKMYMLNEWLFLWLENYKKPNLKPNSIRQLDIIINKHILFNVENKILNLYDIEDFQKALNKIKSSRMKTYTYDTLHDSFKIAYQNGYIQENIIDKIKKPSHERKKGNSLTIDEEKYFLKIIKNNKLELYYKFLIFSGCRRSEPLTLTFIDIDFKNKNIHIHGTKTLKSDRYIPLFNNLLEVINHFQFTSSSDLIFNYTVNCIECNFKRLKKKYNINFKIHDLRHTFATRCLEKGINIKVVQKWLGHSRLDTTASVYTHVMQEFEQLEIKKLNNSESG